eukprot:2156110-Prymnesium_polylepis.1
MCPLRFAVPSRAVAVTAVPVVICGPRGDASEQRPFGPPARDEDGQDVCVLADVLRELLPRPRVAEHRVAHADPVRL